MPTIVVNTAADTVASDGKTSLREAVQQAGKMSGHVDIVFDDTVFYTQGASVSVPIVLTETLTITKGNITIDGSLFYAGNGFGLKISGGGISTNAITVEAGATVTLRDLTIEGSTNNTNLLKAQYGADGHNGTHGSNGVPDYVGNGVTHGGPGNGVSGGHATDGADAPNDAESGRSAVGAVINRGTLTLERVDIESFKTEGGAGGLGGIGGGGGRGGNGQNGTPDSNNVPVGIPGDGGNGGNSGAGARGGEGGEAVGGIYNVGTLTLRDVAFFGLAATGGNGGAGGRGWSGGHGGNSGESQIWAGSLELAHAGDGGAGGNGGNGGRGGVAASALLNIGTVKWDGVQSGVIGATLKGGAGGQRGEGGREGFGGHAFEAFDPNDPRNGHDSAIAGVNGISGSKGGEGDFVGASVATGTTFSLNASKETVSETGSDLERIVYFNIQVLGSNTGVHSVKWTYVPGDKVTAADFDYLAATSGTVTFSNGETGKGFAVRVKDDGESEGIESFTVKLSDPNGGVLGWSKEVAVYIVDGSADGKAPTAIKLSDTSLNENSKNNTKLGSLSTTDGDKGDRFTYELLDSASGRYKLVGDTIKVANATLLDYEQAKSHTIKVRSTDLFGNSIDKKIKITLEDVDGEKIKGNSDANKLFGGDGKDTIAGALGNDTLKGGADADRFVFNSALGATANVDHLTDFKHATDKIALDNAIFTKLSGSTLAATAFHAAATPHDDSDRILYQKSTGKLFYDADGTKTGGADPILFAVLDTHPTLDASDFLIV